MTGVNHVAGGVVFTGLFTSFWNVNIFKNPWLFFFTVFFAILPDIDHTKSPIGKAFYPIAKILDKKFGHRTITHSLVFYLVLGLIVSYVEKIFSNSHDVSLIFWFAYLSHILFDMMTVQGVPFFYPFRRNPCVIPGDAKLRLRTADLRSEAIVFCVFIMLGITCKNLFLDGFWSTYNRAFGTLKHLSQEYNSTDELIKLDYSITRQGKEIKGTGYVIESKEKEALIFNENSFIEITDKDRINKLDYQKTGKIYQTKELFFFNIEPDSLIQIVENKPILSLKLQSNTSFSFLDKNKPREAKTADLESVFNPSFTFEADTSKESIKKQLELIDYEIHKEHSKALSIQQERHRTISRIDQIVSELDNMDNFDREHATKELNELRSKLDKIESNEETGKLEIKKKHLLEQLNQENQILISGYLHHAQL